MRFICRRCNLPSPRNYHKACFDEMYHEQQLLTAHSEKQKKEARRQKTARTNRLKKKIAKARSTPRVDHDPEDESDVEKRWDALLANSANPEARFEDAGNGGVRKRALQGDK